LAALRAPELSDESVGALVVRLRTDVERIVRAEAAVIQLRLSTAVRVVKTAGIGLLSALLLGAGGFGALVAGGVLLLAASIPAWIAAFAIGGGLLVVAAVVAVVEVSVLSRGLGESLTAPEQPLPRGIPHG